MILRETENEPKITKKARKGRKAPQAVEEGRSQTVLREVELGRRVPGRSSESTATDTDRCGRDKITRRSKCSKAYIRPNVSFSISKKKSGDSRGRSTLLRGTIFNRTYGRHKTLYISLFVLLRGTIVNRTYGIYLTFFS